MQRTWCAHAIGIALCLIAFVLGSTTAHAQPKPKLRDITGTVVDVDEKPVANATVTVTGGPSATTAADGTFKLAGAAVTNLTIEVAAEGFTAKQVPVLGAATPLQLQIVLVKPAPAAPPPVETRMITGVVTDAKRAPVGGATVKVQGTELQVITNADGTFVIPNAPIAETTLEISAANQPPTTATVAPDRAVVAVTVGQVEQQPPPPTTRRVRGKVIDPNSKEPIVGAQITEKKTGAVVFTEADGGFVLENLPLGPVQLEVSAAEHETKLLEVPEGKETVDVPLGLATGEQIVIEGRVPVIVKTNLANGASVVKGDDLNRVSSETVDQAMQGKLAGANLQYNSGAPGGGAQLRLRGISTINGQSSPLYVIDGVVVSNVSVPTGGNAITAAAAGGNQNQNQDNSTNRIADLNPNDIETVEVLKGASAAALYGSKAANGVVIITTKHGRNGENHAEVTQRFGVSQVSNTLGSRKFATVDDVKNTFCGPMDTPEECDMNPLVKAYNASGGKAFNHENEITRTPFASETLASVSGGTDKGNYYGSVLVRQDPGVLIGTFYDKQSGRVAVGYSLWDKLHLGFTANLVHSLSDRGLTNNDNTGTSNYVVLSGTPNFVDLRPTNGIYPVNPAVGSGANPLQTVHLLTNREEVYRLITGATLQLDAYANETSNVKVLSNFGADSFSLKNRIFSPNQITFEPADGLDGTSIDGTVTNLNYNLGIGALWTYTPRDKKFRSALSGGLTYEVADLNQVVVTAQNLTAGQPNVDSGTVINASQNRVRTEDQGVYVQEEVALLDEQLSLLGGLLAERSSLDGDTDQLFFYPKLAAVYSLIKPNEEHPIGPFKDFETFRVRAAYGEAGNRPNYGQKFTPLTATGNIDGNAGITILGNAGDPKIEPERQREFEIGADMATKNQRFVAELTGYDREISNLLLQRSLAVSTGFTTQFFNGGGMRNIGIEAALQGRVIPGFDWTTRGVLTLNRSTITSLPVPPFDITVAGFGTGLGAFRIEKGKSATQIVGTVDADGTVKQVGDGEPDFRFGWTNVVNVGDWSFGALIDWQQGSSIVNLTRLLYDASSNSPDADAASKRLMTFSGGDIRPYIESATFVKLRELSIAYNLPKRVMKQLGALKSLQVSLTGRNLLTLTNYSGLDPEVSNFGNQPIGRNYDVAPYPPSRSYWLSVTAGI